MTIDTEQESAAITQRSYALAEQLDAALVTVDRTAIREALAESRRLRAAAVAARSEVERRLARGEPPGCLLGPHGPIRQVRSTPGGRDLEPYLRGRDVLTSEVLAYFEHRRDVLADALPGRLRSSR
jgi:hypothetical protein